MSSKPSVTLTFAGDEKKLTEAMDRVGKAGKEMGNQVGNASAEMGSKVKASTEDVSRSVGKAETSIHGMGDAFDGVSKSMVAKAAVLGLSLGDAFGNIFAQANVGGKLAAQLGGGAEQAALYGRLAGQIYADNFGESMQDVAAGLKSVIGFNLVDEDAADADLKRVTEKLLTVSQVVEDETGNVARAVQQMLRTGLADSAEEAFDLIVRAQQQGLNKSGDLLDTLNEYGTQFRKLGLDGPQALGLISQAIRAGARDSDIAADAIKEFSIRAIDGSKTTSDALKTLFGKSWDDVVKAIAAGGPQAAKAFDQVLDKVRAIKDPVQQSQIAVALFGTQAEDLGAALQHMDLSTAVDEFGNLAGATDNAMTAIGETPEAKFEAFKRGMEQDLIDVINRAAPLLEGFGRFVSQNADLLLPLAGIIAGVTAAQWAWNAAMNANPFVLVLTGLALIVVGITQLWEHSAAFRDFFIDVWLGIQTIIGAVVQWAVDRWNSFIEVIKKVPEALSAVGGMIERGFKNALNIGIDVINWFVDRANDIIYGINVVSPFDDIPYIPHVARLHTGGTVPGMPGTETLALLQAGEHVSAAGQGGGYELRASGSGALFEVIQAAIRDGDLQLVGR